MYSDYKCEKEYHGIELGIPKPNLALYHPIVVSQPFSIITSTQ